ncbi:MAG: 30S ribosomal protein S8 [Ignavibacteria bacterium]|jgi:small subunit ribosomal protein S8|nr:30S ribosomal protein S8 [Ignavibacteria bacterium]MCU7499153.1 30S ribosomal protein S8 [Ignavibacteria bacterium]MCU7502495.1 30S ribosomal protein S8 [Ignavibacteria bacterium]MCU7512955.1 30S ribosomal protein S8 [Ignavibacteria bacterium]MCU7514940.1 30S ribosomal protein S8 [Ignavibacteria bacterium]
MPVTDPIADFLTRIRNAVKAKKKFVEIPSSAMKRSLTEILKNESFITGYEVIEDNKQNFLKLQLKYIQGSPSISGLKRVSTPGLRIYAGKDNLPKVLNGLGIAVISTSKGLMTEKQAKKEAVGGEVLCHIW